MAQRAPTPPVSRADAVRAYVAAEALCDAGRVPEGVRAFKAARTLAWELDGEEWPVWASELYAALSTGRSVDDRADPPPLLAEHGSDALHPLSGCLCGARPAGPDWWHAPEAVAALADALRKRHLAVLDGFVGARAVAELRDACAGASLQLRPASDRSRAMSRSDQVSWEPSGFETLSERADALIGLLRRSGLCPELKDVTSRQRLMFSRYACGDYFARHVDNDCAHGHGPRCSPRVLTCVFYLQPPGGWDARADGGCMRIFRPQCVTDEVEEGGDGFGGRVAPGADALVDIAPIADRLVLFYSDQRCPHEVLPVRRPGAERWAVTIWYMGGAAVPEWWATGTAHDSSLVPLWAVG